MGSFSDFPVRITWIFGPRWLAGCGRLWDGLDRSTTKGHWRRFGWDFEPYQALGFENDDPRNNHYGRVSQLPIPNLKPALSSTNCTLGVFWKFRYLSHGINSQDYLKTWIPVNVIPLYRPWHCAFGDTDEGVIGTDNIANHGILTPESISYFERYLNPQSAVISKFILGKRGSNGTVRGETF